MRLMLKNDYEQKIKLKNEELEKSRKDTEMSQLQYELDNLNNRNKRFNTNTNYNENNEDQLFEKIIDKSKEIEIETQKRQNDKVIKQIMNNTYNSLKTYDLEDVDKSMQFSPLFYIIIEMGKGRPNSAQMLRTPGGVKINLERSSNKKMNVGSAHSTLKVGELL